MAILGEIIRKEGNAIVLHSRDMSKVLGRWTFGAGGKYADESAARHAALKRERQIEYFKRFKEVVPDELASDDTEDVLNGGNFTLHVGSDDVPSWFYDDAIDYLADNGFIDPQGITPEWIRGAIKEVWKQNLEALDDVYQEEGWGEEEEVDEPPGEEMIKPEEAEDG